MYLWSGLEPRWQSLQNSPRPSSWWGGGSTNSSPTVGLRPQISALWASGVPPKRHGFREQSKLLQRVPVAEKVEKHCMPNNFKVDKPIASLLGPVSCFAAWSHCSSFTFESHWSAAAVIKSVCGCIKCLSMSAMCSDIEESRGTIRILKLKTTAFTSWCYV